MNGRTTTFSHRILIATFFGLFLFFFILVAFRLYILQCLSFDKYRNAANNIQIQRIMLEPQRGWIFDRNGNPLVGSIEYYVLVASPKDINMRNGLAESLSAELERILNISEIKILDKLQQNKERAWMILERNLTMEQAEKIMEIRDRYRIRNEIKLEIIGKRVYPKGELACHLLGPVGIGHPELKSGGWSEHRALGGLELERDNYLIGSFGISSGLQDRDGNLLTALDDEILLDISGEQLYLTIDLMIQHIAEVELEKTINQFKAKNGMVIVMEPNSGNILAIANYPRFDPENYNRLSNDEWRIRSINRAVEIAFEPGSTFKIFPAAAALQENIISPNDTFDGNQGRIEFAGRRLRDVRPHGIMTFSEVIEVSSNIGMHQIGERLGAKLSYQYIRKFGFGNPTGIELPGETSGLIQPLSDWTPLKLSRISFGQSIAVSAIQLINALSAIANGGMLMKPNIVKAIYNMDGDLLKEYQPRPIHRVIEKETAQIISEIMEGVVLRGTGKLAALTNHRVAGKTGTAQISIPGERGYKEGKYLASFIGFLPVESPQLVIGVFIEEPTVGGYHGGIVAAPLFRNIAEAALAQLEIHPQIAYSHQELPSLEYRNNKILFNEIKSEKTLGEYRIRKNELYQLNQNINYENEIIMPNLIGMTKRQAMIYLADKNLNVIWQGSGVVLEQYPEAGKKIRAGVKSKIILGNNSKLLLSHISEN